MAKQKKLSKKIKNLMQYDMLMSIAVTSLLLNLFFFTGIILFTSTNSLDENVFRAAYSNLCDENYDTNLVDRMEQSDAPAAAKTQFEVDCLRGDFNRFYRNAVEAYYINQQ